MVGYSELASKIKEYLPLDQCQSIYEAFLFAENAHIDQKRHTGQPYIGHPVAVAIILAEYHLDFETIQAALLHDVLEDTSISKEELASFFGEKVSNLVDGVSKLKQIKFPSRAHEQAENLRKMMFAVVEDIRVLLIKLADRLHNMRTLIHVPSRSKRERKAQETLDIYAPIAHRLGMNLFKNEFEDLGFQMLYPSRYRVIKSALEKLKTKHSLKIQEVKKELEEKFEIFGIPACKIEFHEKHLYSIYKKMKRKQIKFREVSDLLGFQIVVYSLQDCYRALGLLHNNFKPVLGKFKDFIAIPKANGYQSIHTTLLMNNELSFEFQIRTYEMDIVSNQGVAAPWIYDSPLSLKYKERAEDWIKSIIDLQTHHQTSLEFIENMKSDLESDEVYVFDEIGEIWTLPKGSTAIDLAYARSIKEAHHCVGCYVDRKLKPLSVELKSGQRIELLYSIHSTPNSGWLTFATTGKARAHIRHWLREQQYLHSMKLGKKIILRQLAACLLTEKDLHDHLNQNKLANTLEELYSDIGFGRIVSEDIVKKICNNLNISYQGDQTILSVDGKEGLVLDYAPCCMPIVGDPISAYPQEGLGLHVHRESCVSLQQYPFQHIISIDWKGIDSLTLKCRLELECFDQMGALATIATVIAEQKSNIISLKTQPCADQTLQNVELILTVGNRVHLATIMKRLRQLSFIRKIKRV